MFGGIFYEEKYERWIGEVIAQDKKKGMPILSFPGAKILNVTVDQLVKDGHLQALCMESIAKKYDMGMAVSLMVCL